MNIFNKFFFFLCFFLFLFIVEQKDFIKKHFNFGTFQVRYNGFKLERDAVATKISIFLAEQKFHDLSYFISYKVFFC